MTFKKLINITYIIGLIFIILAIYTWNRTYITGDFLYSLNNLLEPYTFSVLLSIGVIAILVEFVVSKHYINVKNTSQFLYKKVSNYFDNHSNQIRNYSKELLVVFVFLFSLSFYYISSILFIITSSISFLYFIYKVLMINLHKSLVVVLLPAVAIITLEALSLSYVAINVITTVLVLGTFLTLTIFFIVRMSLEPTTMNIKLYSTTICTMLLSALMISAYVMIFHRVNTFENDTSIIIDYLIITLSLLIIVISQIVLRIKYLKIAQ